MLFFLFFLSMMTASQAKSYKREQKFLSEHPNNILSEKETHPKYRPSKYMKETTALTDMENQNIVNGITAAGSPEKYAKTIYCLEPEEPGFQEALQAVENAKRLYKKEHSKPKTLNAKILEKKSCGSLMQEVNSGACNLYSFLGAALNVDAFRKKLKKLIVNEDENNAYIKFPYLGPSKAPQEFKKTFDTVYKVSKEIYSSAKGTLLPSENFWVQAISRAFYEHLTALGFAHPDGYALIHPVENKQQTENHELFFGTKVKILDITGPCVIKEADQTTPTKTSCPKGLILKENGEIEIRKGDGSEQLDGTNKILIVPSPGHARTLYYDKEWKFFDNQGGYQNNKCGLPVEDSRAPLDYTYQVQIISLPQYK